MNSSELKYNYEKNDPDGHFFDLKTMQFFGDTMANFGVRKTEISGQAVYELYRKRPVKHGLKKSAYFHTITFEIIHKIED